MTTLENYKHELSALIGRAEGHDLISILVNSEELGDALGGFAGSATKKAACVGAMRAEMGTHDRMVLTENSFSGLTIRYLLPRSDKARGNNRSQPT